MHPLVFRLLVAVALSAAGAAAGALAFGDWLGNGTAVALGLLGGGAVFLAQDGWRAARLLAWLRGTQEGRAPRDTALWGELGYRIERALRQRDQAVRREAERLGQFLSAIEASPNGVLLLDEQDRIAWCSRVAADHFGLDPQRDLSQPVTNLVRAPEFVALLAAPPTEQPLLGTALRGGRQTLAIQLRPYGDGKRLVLSQDVTERERAESMRRDFVANVSHEIRTPLTVLAGFVETLASVPIEGADRARVLGLMQQQTDRMQALVADLLTLARLEGSPRPPAGAWFALDEVIARAVEDGRALSDGRHTITLEPGPALELAGERGEWFSAVGNLISNAVRYTPGGGRITVRCRLHADGAAVVEVEDTGIGIPREHLPRLTERFYRVDGSRSRETGGTGLGLAIVKHIAQRHGGEVEIRSEPGKGSCFSVGVAAARVRPLQAPTGDALDVDAAA